MMDKLSDDEIKSRLAALDDWEVKDGCLIKEFKFKDFAAAMDFMNGMAPVAEELNHHPDWSNSYNKVLISLTSHSAGGLTENDFAFAQAADQKVKP